MSKFAVQIKNFQAIENAKLEFEDGLTVIVGPSNNGKSAIFRAIEAAIYNKAGNSFIKTGTGGTAVALKNDDHLVLWKKTPDAGVYKVDGQTYNKIGRGQLAEVAEAIGISEIDVNGDKVRICFLKQMDYPFLLDKGGTQLFEFLAMSNESDKLSSVFQAMRSDLKQTNSSIDITIGSIDSYKEVIRREETLLENYSNIDETLQTILSYEIRVKNYEELKDKVADLRESRQILQNLKGDISTLRSAMQSLAPIDTVESRVQRLGSLKSDTAKLRTSHQALTELRTDILSLRETIQTIDQTLSHIDITDIETRRTRIASLRTAVASLRSANSAVVTAESAIESLRSELSGIQSQLSEFTVCPLCGQALQPTITRS